MLQQLHDVIAALPSLLRDRDAWHSLHITYHPPRVERLWCQHGNLRVFLHRIWPTDADVLYHPHPWPSAVRVVRGRYVHTLGDETGPLSTSILAAGSEYEMTNPRAWHSVRPDEGPSDSIMVVGSPHSPKPRMPVVPTEPTLPLDPARFDGLLDEWAWRI